MELYIGQRFSNHWHEDCFEIVTIYEEYVTMLNRIANETFDVPKKDSLPRKPSKYEY